MGLSNLEPDERRRVVWVLSWIDRMAERYGGTVREKNGQTWDWGQALCRLCYGPNWQDVISEQNIQTPTDEDIAKAKEWEAGKHPDWFVIAIREVEE